MLANVNFQAFAVAGEGKTRRRVDGRTFGIGWRGRKTSWGKLRAGGLP
ncbi:hypothetical protein ABIA00_007688 [Bradyrhizobium ottawaense]